MSITISKARGKTEKTEESYKGRRSSSSSSQAETNTRELSRCLLEMLDFIVAHHDDSAELIDSVKPPLESILRNNK